jgi:3-dehydroquinate dehydratase
MLPYRYDCAVVNRNITQEVIDVIAQATNDTVCALIEYCTPYSHTSMPVVERDCCETLSLPCAFQALTLPQPDLL